MKNYKKTEEQKEYEEFLKLADNGYVDVDLWLEEIPEDNNTSKEEKND